MNKFLIVLVILLAIVSLAALTRINVNQIRPPATPPIAPMAITALPDGSVSWQIIQTPPLINFVDNEVPAGVIDGVNGVFTLAHPPNPPSSLQLYRNGIHDTISFTLTGATITFAAPVPEVGAVLAASYRW